MRAAFRSGEPAAGDGSRAVAAAIGPRMQVWVSAPGYGSQAFQRASCLSTHFLAAASGVMSRFVDHVRDEVLVGVRPLPVLDERGRVAAGVVELSPDELLAAASPVVAGDRLRVRVAALGVGRERNPGQLDLRVQPVRVPPVEEQRLLLGHRRLDRLDRGGLAAREDDLEVQAEVLDEGLVVLDVRRVGAEEPAQVTGFGGLELVGVVAEVLDVGEDLGAGRRRRTSDVSADDPDAAVLAGVHRDLLVRDVQLLELGAPNPRG